MSLSRRKSTTRFGVSPFPRRKVTIFIGRETTTHILPTKINENKFAKVSSTNKNYSFRIINHSTTKINQQATSNKATIPSVPSPLKWTLAGSTVPELLSEESSDGCARVGDTSISSSLWPWLRCYTSQPFRDRRRPGSGREISS